MPQDIFLFFCIISFSTIIYYIYDIYTPTQCEKDVTLAQNKV